MAAIAQTQQVEQRLTLVPEDAAAMMAIIVKGIQVKQAQAAVELDIMLIFNIGVETAEMVSCIYTIKLTYCIN